MGFLFFLILFGLTVGTYFPAFANLFTAGAAAMFERLMAVGTDNKVMFYISVAIRTNTIIVLRMFKSFVYHFRENFKIFFYFFGKIIVYNATRANEEIEKYSRRRKENNNENRNNAIEGIVSPRRNICCYPQNQDTPNKNKIGNKKFYHKFEIYHFPKECVDRMHTIISRHNYRKLSYFHFSISR